MEGQSRRNGPLLQVDLSVMYKRLKNDGLKKKGKEKEQTKASSVPNHSSVCVTGKSQHHKAHTHPHQTALFLSVQRAVGKGVKRHTVQPEKRDTNQAEQDAALDRTCFLSRLIVLSHGAWAKS